MVECKQNLHEIVPDRVFGYWSVVLLSLLNDSREVSTSAVFHKNIENTGFAVNVTVMISYYVFVVQVFQDIAVKTRQFRS